ncbi:MAG: elongation factor G [Eubacteriales bacterium]|nr:elongation factor G [Eubacteriales bacterium]
MNVYATENIRNVVLLGHGGCGKTALIENMAFATGIIKRVRTAVEGGTVSDYDKEEMKRQFSIQSSVIPLEVDGIKVNLLDTPGLFDFAGEVYEALSVADGAVIIVNGKSGVEVGTRKSFDFCAKRGIPVIVYISNVEDEHVDVQAIVEELRESYGNKIVPFHMPMKEGAAFKGFMNAVKMLECRLQPNGTYAEEVVEEGANDELDDYRMQLMEGIAETSEELMEKYFEGEAFTEEEIKEAIVSSVANRDLMPVICGAIATDYSANVLLHDMVKYFSAPGKVNDQFVGKETKTGSEVKATYDVSKPASAYVFKTIADPFVGRFSLIKVTDGIVKADSALYNGNKDVEERIGKLYVLRGKEQLEVNALYAGDIGAIAKLSSTKTSDTLSQKSNPIVFEAAEMPEPYTFLRYITKTKGDEDKVSSALKKLMDEDLTLREVNDKANRQMLLYGLGDQHLDIVKSKLADRYKVEIEFIKPKVAFKETIRGKYEIRKKYKKQSGGHGQYGDVNMIWEPSGDLETPYVFEEKIFGGAVPKNYFPAVEKGIAECCLKGPLAGYPVVGIKGTLTDGSYHPVDSSEMAFKMASIAAFKEGILQAKPVLLEPIVNLKVNVLDVNTGDVMGDLNKRRGRILGMNPIPGGRQELECDIPLASLVGYSTDLRSMTGGSGEFSYVFSRYEQMPGDAQEAVLKEVEAEKEAEK